MAAFAGPYQRPKRVDGLIATTPIIMEYPKRGGNKMGTYPLPCWGPQSREETKQVPTPLPYEGAQSGEELIGDVAPAVSRSLDQGGNNMTQNGYMNRAIWGTQSEGESDACFPIPILFLSLAVSGPKNYCEKKPLFFSFNFCLRDA